MALNAAAVFEVRTTGNDDNGGAFRAGGTGTDYSQQDVAQVFIDGATISATVHTTTSQITLVGYTVSADDVNNHINITGGTATAGLYEITSVDVPNNRWVLDRSVGTSTQTVVGRMGGAFASPGRAGQFKIASNTVYIRTGTYVLSALSNVSGGRVTEATAGVTTAPNRWIGYQTARGDGGTKPSLKSGANSVVAFTSSGINTLIENLECRRDTVAGHTGFVGFTITGARTTVKDCSVYDANGSQAYSCQTGANIRFVRCYAENPVVGFATIGTSGTYEHLFCVSRGHTSAGFNGGAALYVGCLAIIGTNLGFDLGASGCTLIGCVSYGNTGAGVDGFELRGGGTIGGHLLINCVAINNGSGTAYGFQGATGVAGSSMLINCSAFGNSTGDYNTTNIPASSVVGFVSLSADPFTNGGALNFTTNTAAGFLLHGRGYPSSFPGLDGVNYPDIGAYQFASIYGSRNIPNG